ncbi:MAG: prolyl oligopeptidase family serine peptidase [Candidatus Marinimicrobia bacterium]|nr:prolyl oligopeptidase family serine peptidase [Candidatus Neomarinimicrobiota bacterium]MDD9930751.1 prolyl oligopeptidase family serine peptidase [Candidatus Neomarinimicrobiota bacterium]
MKDRIIKYIGILLWISMSSGLAQEHINSDSPDKIKLKYLLHLPNQYEKYPQMNWPVILFLHGMGERGDNLELLKIHGMPKITSKNKDFPFIAISPQCPIDNFWNDTTIQDALMGLLNEIISNYRTDKNRIYLTGLSMGGYGTWSLAAKHPNVFAAAVPICGGGDPSTVKRLKDMPIWAFHGAKDTVVPSSETEAMVSVLKKIGGNVKYTLYPDAYHDSWTKTYENEQLYKWLLSHQK